MLERNYVFEFAGMPKSGKTTLIDIVSHYLRRTGYADDISDFHGGGRYAPIKKNDINRLNLYLATESMRYLLCVKNPDRKPKIHLMDRGINDRIIFSEALCKEGRVSTENKDAIESILLLDEFSNEVDCLFVVTTSVELSLERENKNTIIKTQGRVMNNNLLQDLKDSALECMKLGKLHAKEIVHIDTDVYNNDLEYCAKIIIDKISEHMNSI